MKPTYCPQALSAFMVMIAMLACVTPSQTLAPTPGLDTNTIATAVAGTAQAAAQQTAAAQAPAALKTGISIELLPDQSTRYSDYDAGFELLFPAGWLALQPNSAEFSAVLQNQGAENRLLGQQMEADLARYDPKFDRLFAYSTSFDPAGNLMFGFSKLAWDAQDSSPIDNQAMGEVIRGLESPSGIPGFHADTTRLNEEGAIKMMEIGGRWTLSDGQGASIPFYSTIVFFKPTPSSSARILFSFMEDYHAQLGADVKSIIGSIKVIGPQP